MSDGLRMLSAAIGAGAMHSVTALDRELFIGDEIEVFEFIKGHARAYRELPQASTVRAETGIALPGAPEAVAYYENLLYERHEYNQLRNQFGPLREAMQQQDMASAADIVSTMSRVMRRRRSGGHEVMDIAEAGRRSLERMAESRGYGGVSGVTSGWDGYDEITGGYQKADLISWVGRPSMGKTYVLLKQVAKMHADGESILFVTTEMGQEQIARRWSSISLGINPTVLKRNMLSTYMERRLRSFYQDMLGAERLKIFSVGMNAKVNAVEAYMQEFGPSIVVIDGVYLMKPSEMPRNGSKVDKVSGVFDEIKGLTLEADIPVVVSTQLNRTSGKSGKDASLENLAYADAIGTHSSLVCAIKPGPTANPMQSRELDFLKGREGETGSIAINFKFAPLDMSEIPREEVAAMAEGGGSTDDGGGPNLDWMQNG